MGPEIGALNPKVHLLTHPPCPPLLVLHLWLFTSCSLHQASRCLDTTLYLSSSKFNLLDVPTHLWPCCGVCFKLRLKGVHASVCSNCCSQRALSEYAGKSETPLGWNFPLMAKSCLPIALGCFFGSLSKCRFSCRLSR